jgi:hypothetical protein
MKLVVALVICAITVAMAVGYGVATRPVLADNQLYFFQTERCASGVPPHVSHMEVKTQLPSMLGGASIAMGRVFGIDDVHAGRAATLTCAFFATFFGWLLVLELAMEALAASRRAAAARGAAALRGAAGAHGSARGRDSAASLDSAMLRGSAVARGSASLPTADSALPASDAALPTVRSIGGVPLPALAASLVGIAAIFSIYGLFAEASSGFQPKVYMVAFLMATHLACAQRRYLVTGIAGMCAFLCWQPAGLILAACGLALLVDRRTSWRSLFVMAGGALLALAAYELYFALSGGLAAQLHQEWRLAFGAPHKDKGAAEAIWFFMTEAQTFRDRANGLPSVYVAVVALMWLGALVRPRRTFEAIRERPGLVAFWIAAHIASAFTLYDHQAHPDMLLVQPYFAIACGIGASWVFVVLSRFSFGAAVTAVLAAAFIALGLNDARQDVGRAVGGRTGLEQQRAMARIVSMYEDHRGSVWVLGSVHLLALNRRDNWTNVGNVGHETSELDMKQYRPLRGDKMPEIIVSGRGLRPGGSGWLASEYIDITPVPLAGARIRVFSRKSNDQPGFARTTAPKGAPGPKSTKPPAPKK